MGAAGWRSDCLLPFFYIKPQLVGWRQGGRVIVSYLFSTSNHNNHPDAVNAGLIVSYLFSTSNHNVYLLFCCFTKTYNVKRIHEVVEIELSPCKGTKKIPIAMGLA